MKKLLTLLLVIVAAFTATFAFTACDLFGTTDKAGDTTTEKPSDNDGEKPSDGDEEKPSVGDDNKADSDHEHSYSLKIDPKPTATTQGAAKDICSCGAVKSTTVLPVLTDGKYNKTADTATCGKKGSIKYSITINGDSYYFSVETPATGKHNFIEGVCSCGATDPDYAPHDHNYIAKSDDTGHWTECACGDKTELIPHSFKYMKDGAYHWQVCSVRNESTGKELHTYTDGVCVCGAEEPIDPNGVKSVEIVHKYGDGKYLWNAGEVSRGEYEFYDATLKITRNNGSVSTEPITVEMLGKGLNLTEGSHSLTVTYGGKNAEFSVFVAPENGYIEAVAGKSEIIGLEGDTLMLDLKNPSDFDFGGLAVKGTFNLLHGGVNYSGYYGETPVNERFVRNIDMRNEGLQECKIVAGNMNTSAAVIGDINVMSYNSSVSEEQVFVSGITILKKTDNKVVYRTELIAGKPYFDLNKVIGIDRYSNYDDYRVEFVFSKGRFTEYSGGTDTAVSVSNIVPFDTDAKGYAVSGDTDIWSVMRSTEHLIRLSSGKDEITVPYTVYDSSYTNIRFCRVHGIPILEYALSGGVTTDSIKKDLLKRELYVEYFEKVDGKFVHLVPVSESMFDFSGVDVNSYNKQSGYIEFGDKSIAVNIIKPYSVAGASVSYTLKNTDGVNLLLSDATVNDLAKCVNDACREIVLYNNGVAMLKHTGNGIGNLLIGYELKGNELVLIRHGFATSFLTVDLNKKTFASSDIDSLTADMQYTDYVFTHDYELGGTIPIGWTGRFTAYDGNSGYEYAKYAYVHLSGWASSANGSGSAYQIAGVEYLATWALGWHNNKDALVLRFADYDWWFEIGTANDSGEYRLTFLKKVTAS